MTKKKCYDCKYRGSIPGDVHSCCKHPNLGNVTKDPLAGMMAIFASVGRVSPQMDIHAISKEFEIKANIHGIRNGWFNWPWNFDPIWLENCNAFTLKNINQ